MVVVVGGTGLIGSKLVAKLREHGHEAVPAAPNTGVNTLTGEGLAEVLKGAAVVVDVSNSPSFADDAVLGFFRTSTTNLLMWNGLVKVTTAADPLLVRSRPGYVSWERGAVNVERPQRSEDVRR
jgi:NAD(P)-dependent dehydrogenase (short-subunit alcohol dehydrogenase family)